MRAATINENGLVVNFVEVHGFDSSNIDPIDAQIGSVWNGETFSHPLAVPLTREQRKAAREQAVAAIKVTTQAGNTFDGDEVSQGRMARAIIALQAAGVPAATWVLADNTVIEASVAELSEALVLSGLAQSAIWVIA